MTTTKTRLGCLHMHHSNIAYVDGIVDAERVEALHFVDPGLMRRIGGDAHSTANRRGRRCGGSSSGWRPVGSMPS